MFGVSKREGKTTSILQRAEHKRFVSQKDKLQIRFTMFTTKSEMGVMLQ